MYEAKELLFIYCVSPVHMGAGTALGAIDSPIQRERHTQHPMMAGTGLKGALRHTAWERWHVRDEGATGDAGQRGKRGKERLTRLFGPDTNAAEHAGAVALSDAALVLFPVRSLRRSFVYATCPTALARLGRLATLAGLPPLPELRAEPERNKAIVGERSDLVTNGNVVLEAFALQEQKTPQLAALAKWISERAVPSGDEHKYFRDKVEKDLVVLHDDRFNYFVRNSTIVEPHVRISDETGTADDGGLFYVENLPPESVLVSLVMASPERRPKEARSGAARIEATGILGDLREEFDQKLVQVGGDATTGRGQVVLSFRKADGGAHG